MQSFFTLFHSSPFTSYRLDNTPRFRIPNKGANKFISTPDGLGRRGCDAERELKRNHKVLLLLFKCSFLDLRRRKRGSGIMNKQSEINRESVRVTSILDLLRFLFHASSKTVHSASCTETKSLLFSCSSECPSNTL